MSLGRYGADDPDSRRVPLNITVDKWVSDALKKIRSKNSVSDMVNGILAIVVRQFDPGPSAPMVYELERVLAEHEARAKASGDPETLAAAAMLRSKLEPYMDLAHGGADGEAVLPEAGMRNRPVAPGELRGNDADLQDRPAPVQKKSLPAREDLHFTPRGYDWYAVPVLCHEKPMTYLRKLRAWKCFVCGGLLAEGGSPLPTGGRPSP